MNKLEQAARQALGALVRAEAMYGQPNADIQTALREALAEQAEQEPVATVVARGFDDGTRAGNTLDWIGRNCENDFPIGTKLYAVLVAADEREKCALACITLGEYYAECDDFEAEDVAHACASSIRESEK